MTLCHLCTSISLSSIRGPNLDQLLPHQPSYFALKLSAKAGCQLCGFIWAALEQGTDVKYKTGVNRAALSHVSDRYPGRQISLAAWGGSGTTLDRIHIITTGDIPEVDGDDDALADHTMHPDYQFALDGVLDLYAEPGDPGAWHGGIDGRPLPISAGDSEDDMNIAKTWLQDCLKSHKTCLKPDPKTPLPTRVIDVGAPYESIEPYLLHSKGRRGLYIALSHCWGGQVPLTTTSVTLKERTRSIPLHSFPKTFREAIVVTRRLGIQYLWIDSLCILQDSKTDWEKESAVMSDIYARSYLTIAARGSINSAGGLFIKREPEPPPCRLRYECVQHLLSGSMYIRSPTFEIERLRDTPLDTRGWVLQERLLSPRILYYGRQQLYWECTQTTLRQDGKAADVWHDDLREGVHLKQALDFNGPLPFSQNPVFSRVYGPSDLSRFEERARLLQWYNVVSEYTIRHLTYQFDKLAAISGIAKAFQERTGYTYLAGLWKEDLIAGMAWFFVKPSDEIISSELPSWTWARLKGRVQFWSRVRGLPLRVIDDSCEVAELKYTLASEHNPYNGIQGVELRVRGRVVEAKYKPTQKPEDEFPTTVFSAEGRQIGRLRFDMSLDEARIQSLFCVLLHGGDDCAAALALERTTDSHVDYYRRIGYVSVLSGKWVVEGSAVFMEVAPSLITIV